MAGVGAVVAGLTGLTLAGRTSGSDRTAVAVHDLATSAATGSGCSMTTSVTYDVSRVWWRWMMMVVVGGCGRSPGDRET